ncbi:YcaO-like family protein [Streptomyces nitrosporeus]|uniref:YcaO-like family protein n=1 Tax=Streptomyces nitrosporeus TaxID=28894 RepID=UPI00167CEBB5|nr:YcaO-like family protein [Streptomyces nitrosporeus]GGZ20006.1 hypothetical protein GCM10010327_59010 [Streptomyces nitrosporeus]
MSLNDALIAAATSVFPFCSRQHIYFADAEAIVTSARRKISLRGTSLGFGERLSRLRCRSELMERWAHLEWELDGSAPLTGRGMASGCTRVGLLQPGSGQSPDDVDGSGYCAGPQSDQDRTLVHGLMEVIERDTIVRILDRHALPLVEATAVVPESLQCLLGGQRAQAQVWIARRPGLPPTALALITTQAGDAAALGTACKYTETQAVTRAVLEGVMMLTTVKHTQRLDSRPPQMQGILWASDQHTALRDELMAMTAPFEPTDHGPGDLHALVAGTVEAFGDEPVAVRFPTRRARVTDIDVWRVVVSGALNPATAERRPWPIG